MRKALLLLTLLLPLGGAGCVNSSADNSLTHEPAAGSTALETAPVDEDAPLYEYGTSSADATPESWKGGGTVSIKKERLKVRKSRMWKADDTPEDELLGEIEGKTDIHSGNQRFKPGEAAHPHQSPDRRRELVPSQHPHTAVLSCSDSRVPPEIIFDQGLGDLFVVRNAGQVADDIATASLEYAVEHLHVDTLLILGHESCGAVKAALTTPPGKSAGSKDLDSLVGLIRPDIKDFTVETAGKGLGVAVKSHVNQVKTKLLKRSKILREAVEEGHLTIRRGIYHLDTGKVDIW